METKICYPFIMIINYFSKYKILELAGKIYLNDTLVFAPNLDVFGEKNYVKILHYSSESSNSYTEFTTSVSLKWL